MKNLLDFDFKVRVDSVSLSNICIHLRKRNGTTSRKDIQKIRRKAVGEEVGEGFVIVRVGAIKPIDKNFMKEFNFFTNLGKEFFFLSHRCSCCFVFAQKPNNLNHPQFGQNKKVTESLKKKILMAFCNSSWIPFVNKREMGKNCWSTYCS